MCDPNLGEADLGSNDDRSARYDDRKFAERSRSAVVDLGKQMATSLQLQDVDREITKESRIAIDDLAGQLTTSLQMQDDLCRHTMLAGDAQRESLKRLEEVTETSSQIIAGIPTQLQETRKRLQR